VGRRQTAWRRAEFFLKAQALLAGGVFDAGVMPESDGEPFSLLVAAVAAHLKQRGATWPSVSSAPPGLGGLLFRQRSPEPPLLNVGHSRFSSFATSVASSQE
jgi:hypothetical protein